VRAWSFFVFSWEVRNKRRAAAKGCLERTLPAHNLYLDGRTKRIFELWLANEIHKQVARILRTDNYSACSLRQKPESPRTMILTSGHAARNCANHPCVYLLQAAE
jgi:hypothetical protein